MTSTARRLATATAALALLLPATAQAGTVAVADGALTIDAETSYIDLDISQDGSDFLVTDYGGNVQPGSGCEAAPADPLALVTGFEGDQYTCSGDIKALHVKGGPEPDFAFAYVSVPSVMTGGDGDDALFAPQAKAHLEGGGGDDGLYADKGDDELIGGPGNDSLSAEQDFYEGEGEAPPLAGTADTLDGGPGRDMLYPGGGTDRVAGGDGRDTLALPTSTAITVSLAAFDGVESVATGEKDDVVTGDAHFNELRTSDGKDTVDGGGGTDIIDTGRGDDSILARDGVADDISCGEDNDRVVADPDDFVDGDCEVVDRAALVVPAPAAPAAPQLQLQARRRGARLVVSGRVVPAAGAPAGACAGGGVTVSVAGLARRVRRIGTVLRADCTFRVRLKASKRATRRARVSASFAGTPGLPAATAAPVRAARR
jgi:hypothetical protein